MNKRQIIDMKNSINGKSLKDLSKEQANWLIKNRVAIVLCDRLNDTWPKAGYLMFADFAEQRKSMVAACVVRESDDGEYNQADWDLDLRRIVVTRDAYPQLVKDYLPDDLLEEIITGVDEDFNDIGFRINRQDGYLFDDDEQLTYFPNPSDPFLHQKLQCCEGCSSIGVYPDSQDPIYLCVDCVGE